MKDFFDSKYHLGIGPLFHKDNQQHELSWNQQPHTFILSTPKMYTLLFDSIRVFKEFSYTPFPSPSHYQCLHTARDCILSIYAYHKWRLAPTTHYLTSHAIVDAEFDGTAYSTLAEGVECKNRDDKKDGRVTFKGKSPSPTAEIPLEHMLNNQQLRLTLTDWGYAPEEFQLISYTSTGYLNVGGTIQPPKYAPPPIE